MADDDTSIKVSKQTRERLARLAAERRTTLKGVVEELAAATFGVVVTDVELAASTRLRDLITRREPAA